MLRSFRGSGSNRPYSNLESSSRLRGSGVGEGGARRLADMVLEKQDSGICLSVEPGSPAAQMERQEGRREIFPWSDGAQRIGKPIGEEMKSLSLEERNRQAEEDEREWLAEENGSGSVYLSNTSPDLSEGRCEDDGEMRDLEQEEKEESQSTKCHHHFHLPDQENDKRPVSCALCRKKEERIRAVRRPVTDDPRSHSVMSNHTDHDHLSRRTPDSERGQFDQNGQSSSRLRMSVDSHPNEHKKGHHTAGHSAGQSGQSTPRQHNKPEQQALLKKLQGTLSKMSPKIFKMTKSDALGTVQDRKILAIMLAKKEDEERQRSLRELAHSQWEEEMRKKTPGSAGGNGGGSRGMTPNSCSSAVDKRRKQSYGDGGQLKRNRPVSEPAAFGGPGSDPQTPCTAHGSPMGGSGEMEFKERGGLAENLDKTRRSFRSSTDLRPQKSREKQIQAMERKKLVEQRLEQQRREMEEHQQQLRRKHEEDLERANSVRLSREQQHILRAKLKNLEAQQKQERINQIKQQSMVDLSKKQETIQTRLSQAELKVQQARQEEAKRRRDELEKRIHQSRLRQQQIETEQEEWHQELHKYQKWKDYQADGLTKENLAKKREAACVERIQREKLQRENMKRLLNQEEQWLNDVEATIAMKDARIRTVMKEKEEQIQKSRAIASASQRMREELKMHYSMNDLDQVSRQVVLENRLATRGNSATQNNSTLTPDF